jgi:REP element-mobilizing transposase RayT
MPVRPHVVDGEMRLNKAGEIARRCWGDIPHHFPYAMLDAMAIMPNHVHGIIVIQGRGEASVPLHVSEERPESDASPLQPYSP